MAHWLLEFELPARGHLRRFLLTLAVLPFVLVSIVASAADEKEAASPPVSVSTPQPERKVAIRDITTIAGIRENPLVGYSIVVGLNGTGDRRQTLFTVQTLANIMQRMGVQIPASQVRVNNVAAVFVTATLPPFARPGTALDVTVSSIGDAKSLEGGVLLLTPLRGADGQVYADAQGPLTLGGYSAGGGTGNSKQLNHPTVGRIPNGGTVERDTAVDLARFASLSLMLRDPNFTAARDISIAINQSFGKAISTVVNSRQIDVKTLDSGSSTPELISQIQNLTVRFHPAAKVVVNERTGTIVMGGDVTLSPVSVIHGGLTVEVTTQFSVSQPEAFSKGRTTVVPEQAVQAEESKTRSIRLAEGASVEELIGGLQSMGASARDIVAILQAIKAAGGLQAELEVL